MRNTLAQVVSLFAMALVAVAVINPHPAQAGMVPLVIIEEACLERGERPEFCATLPTDTETDSDADTDTETEAEEYTVTVWIPRSAMAGFMSHVPAPEPVTGLEAGNMIVWDMDPETCGEIGFTGNGAAELAAQGAYVLRSLSATLAQAQADMASSLTEASQTSWLYYDYKVNLGELTAMSVELAYDIERLDRDVLSFPDTDDLLHGRKARHAQELCEEQGNLLNSYSDMWIDVTTVAAEITRARLGAGVSVAPWRADPYGDMDRLAVRGQMTGLNALIPTCMDDLDRRLRDMGFGYCIDN